MTLEERGFAALAAALGGERGPELEAIVSCGCDADKAYGYRIFLVCECDSSGMSPCNPNLMKRFDAVVAVCDHFACKLPANVTFGLVTVRYRTKTLDLADPGSAAAISDNTLGKRTRSTPPAQTAASAGTLEPRPSSFWRMSHGTRQARRAMRLEGSQYQQRKPVPGCTFLLTTSSLLEGRTFMARLSDQF